MIELAKQQIQVRLRFTEAVLGTVPEDYSVWETFVRPKIAAHLNPEKMKPQDYAEQIDELLDQTEDEVQVHPAYANAEEARRRDKADRDADKTDKTLPTTFFRDANGPIFLNYQVLGHLKELGNIAKDALKIKALRNKIGRYVSVTPRRIPLEHAELGRVTRPLRGETMQGPRIFIATSDAVRAGAEIAFTLHIIPNPEVTPDVLETLLRELGSVRGLGQWRTGGWGTYEVVEFTVHKDSKPRSKAVDPV